MYLRLWYCYHYQGHDKILYDIHELQEKRKITAATEILTIKWKDVVSMKGNQCRNICLLNYVSQWYYLYIFGDHAFATGHFVTYNDQIPTLSAIKLIATTVSQIQ